MTHEPECVSLADGEFCICPEIRRAYRRGYNDRARSAVHTYQMYGIPEFNQHGGGVNP